jgi:hypothetical protein
MEKYRMKDNSDCLNTLSLWIAEKWEFCSFGFERSREEGNATGYKNIA